jgi:tetratricopeptide (TPR) repeat protein
VPSSCTLWLCVDLLPIGALSEGVVRRSLAGSADRMCGAMNLLESEQELRVLSSAVAAAGTGAGSAVVVHGSPGIGKSRLLHELSRIAADRGARTLSATGIAGCHGAQFSVLRQLFADVGVTAPHELYRHTVALAHERPLVICLDDADHADDSSLQWLSFLARRLSGLRVLIAVALSTERMGLRGLTAAGLAVERGWPRVRLSPLTRDATDLILAKLLAKRPEPAFGARFHQVTSGVPLLANGLATSLAEEGVLPTDENVGRIATSASPGLSSALEVHIARQLPEVRTYAVAAAVLCEPADPLLVAEVADIPAAAAQASERHLTALHLLTDGAFVTAGVRDALLAGKPLASLYANAARVLHERGYPHEQVTSRLLVTEPIGKPWVVPVLRATAEEALRGKDVPRAVACLTRLLAEPLSDEDRLVALTALGKAELSAAPATAVDHLLQAKEIARPGRLDAQLTVRLARALAATGRSHDALALLDESVEHVAGQDREAALRLETSYVEIACLTPDTMWRAGLRLNQLRDEVVDARSPGERDLLGILAAVWSSQSREPASVVAAAARRALDGGLVAWQETRGALVWAILALKQAGLTEEARHHCDLALGEARRMRLMPVQARLLTIRADIAYQLGSLHDALRLARESYQIFDTAGMRKVLPAPAAQIVRACISLGDLDHAAKVLTELGGFAEPGMTEQGRLICERGRLKLAMGDDHEGAQDIAAAGRLFTDAGMTNPAVTPWRSACAMALVRLGRQEEAAALVAEELRLARWFGAPAHIGVALRAAA